MRSDGEETKWESKIRERRRGAEKGERQKMEKDEKSERRGEKKGEM